MSRAAARKNLSFSRFFQDLRKNPITSPKTQLTLPAQGKKNQIAGIFPWTCACFVYKFWVAVSLGVPALGGYFVDADGSG